MDSFEKYIRENKEELDRIESVDADALWNRIQTPEAEISRPAVSSKSGWHLQIGHNWRWSAAATVILALGLGIWFYLPNHQQNLTGQPDAIAILDYYPELAEQEMNFRRTVARKEAELAINQINRQQYIDIFHELDELEKIHHLQIKDLPEVFDNQEWVRTLMRYYEQKLRILERLSREMDKKHQQEERRQARSI